MTSTALLGSQSRKSGVAASEHADTKAVSIN
jgi:hypothetical protein